jgi:hypothetical protein
LVLLCKLASEMLPLAAAIGNGRRLKHGSNPADLSPSGGLVRSVSDTSEIAVSG